MNAFEKSEELGRAKFKELAEQNGWEVHFTENQFERYDALVSTTFGKHLVEIKNRALKYKDFDSLIVDQSKIDNLVQLSNSTIDFKGEDYKQTVEVGESFVFIFIGEEVYFQAARDIQKNADIKEILTNITTSVYRGKTYKNFYEYKKSRFKQMKLES